MTDACEPDLLDQRQRHAAALILSAIDLPAPAEAWALQAIQAASVCPGITVGELVLGRRRAQLVEARNLLDAMISEAA